MSKYVAPSDKHCPHCNAPLFSVLYRWSKGDRIETVERGEDLGLIHSTSKKPPIEQGTALLCDRCDGGAVKEAMRRT